jgi:hypothetical protein
VSRGVHSALYIIRKVPYTRLVNALSGSSCVLGVIYVHSNALPRMHSNVRGIDRMFGGLSLGARRSHALIHAVINVPFLSSWTLNQIRKFSAFGSYVDEAQASVLRLASQS